MDPDNFLHKLKTILSFIELSKKIAPIHGYLLEIQGYALYLLAAEGPGVGEIVEIGSFMGRSTCCLALGAKRAHRELVYAVDHFKGSPEHQEGAKNEVRELVEKGTTMEAFLENIERAGVADRVRPIAASSEEAVQGWERPIRLLFIDGDHAYEASRCDFESWAPHVVPGGIIVFHDIGHFDGVTRFYNELLQSSPNYREILNIAGMAILEKTVENEPRAAGV